MGSGPKVGIAHQYLYSVKKGNLARASSIERRSASRFSSAIRNRRRRQVTTLKK